MPYRPIIGHAAASLAIAMIGLGAEAIITDHAAVAMISPAAEAVAIAIIYPIGHRHDTSPRQGQ